MAADISSLEPLLTYWERAEYISVAVVILGVAGEYISDFTNLLTGGDEAKKKRFERISTLVLIAALAVELVCLVGTNILSGRIIASLNETAEHERLETLKLQSLLGPRQLTEEQQKEIATGLSKWSMTAVDLFVFDGDEWTRFESLRFAQLLAPVLDKAGLDTRVYWGSGCGMLQPLMGVDVNTTSEASLENQIAGKEIKDLFAKPGSGVEVAFFPRPMPNCKMFAGISTPDPGRANLARPEKLPREYWAPIRIMVGNKPPTMLDRPTVQDVIRPLTPPPK